ncbi:hypothetical protein QR680_003199 [Steinernema hermaphroditum]|uniref:Fibronectin type-III domain-containing protein n=1 Tax=Steinernema hermaphroditum TaxID=289476 RepID=A0AA39H7Z2_9BILA|nr:hypothetical protein QR680_003199 [Steinernema hermaphroditum]
MWAAFSTLGVDEPVVLTLQSRTPNSLTVKWTQGWLPSPDSPFTIKGSTIHSVDGSSKEISISSFIAVGKRPQYTLRNLNPGATMNVTIFTRLHSPSFHRLNNLLTKPVVAKKSAWAVFSTLPQGEYVVTEPRIAAETDNAVSIVWRPVDHQNPVVYQIRYTPNDGGASTEGDLLSEAQLICPKFGCDWNCALIYNLARRPRDYSFDVRAKVDGLWNKWVPIARRSWNLLERVCSINPPQAVVENEGRVEYMREVKLVTNPNVDAWKYLLVVDRRGGSDRHISAIDMTRLSDKATSDHEQTPYYITAAFTTPEIADNKIFRIGDGKVYGGYLNYPLENRYENPSWTLIPISQTENEIMEPRLKSCGINEEGVVECDMSVSQIISFVPWWSILGVVLAFLLILLLLSLLNTMLSAEERRQRRKQRILENADKRLEKLLTYNGEVRTAPCFEGPVAAMPANIVQTKSEPDVAPRNDDAVREEQPLPQENPTPLMTDEVSNEPAEELIENEASEDEVRQRLTEALDDGVEMVEEEDSSDTATQKIVTEPLPVDKLLSFLLAVLLGVSFAVLTSTVYPTFMPFMWFVIIEAVIVVLRISKPQPSNPFADEMFKEMHTIDPSVISTIARGIQAVNDAINDFAPFTVSFVLTAMAAELLA